MAPTFDDWKYKLLHSAGSVAPEIRHLGDFVLRLFWQDGCDPTMSGLLDYAQTGLGEYHARSIVPDARIAELSSGRSIPSRTNQQR